MWHWLFSPGKNSVRAASPWVLGAAGLSSWSVPHQFVPWTSRCSERQGACSSDVRQQKVVHGSELAKIISAECPDGCRKADVSKLEAFREGVKDGSRLTVILDFDRTISRGDATECHEMLGFSPELPQSFRDEFGTMYNTITSPVWHEEKAQLLGPEENPDVHAFWNIFNGYLLKHKVTLDMVERAVALEMRLRGPLLRDGIGDLLRVCEKHDVAVIVLSAGFTSVILEVFALAGISLPSSCRVLANSFVTDKDKRIVAVKPHDPPASRRGKLMYLAALDDLGDRPCIIAVGDKTIDAAAVDAYASRRNRGSISNSEVLRSMCFGFLNANDPSDEIVQEYCAAFDILPENGGSCSFMPLTALVRALLE
eukprot:gnl/MRDRNA2_/MRDRNA2_117217_c0_seq1.p1 gnl/MRDRNA2_/MRDRNA2_117217_c0~~gnl/MRDRNA2_/MRDRNA2_117217_c0_seq1.p1  ORF type:complete len:368 (+),score=53.59 gnl/MRDRNA2_/MRDRNA2_117217_c0_seq1:64-1167(+)